MDPDRRKQVEQLYRAALERMPQERDVFLGQACEGDAELRREVASLMAHDHTMTLATPGKRFGSYEVVSMLGKGGMGEVFRAHDPKLGRDVAIKTLPAEFSAESEWLARFRREARTLAALTHPNIAAIHGLEESDGEHYLVMELVEGDTLLDLITKSGPLPLETILKISAQVADALEAAHQKSITHRDIKPANIKVTPEGRVKVLDFGLAKTTWQAGALPERTLTDAGTEAGRVMGTPGYMSPEQVRGQGVDQRSDIWAFGCVLYELLTGKRTFRGTTVADTLAAVLERAPDWTALPARTPERIRALLARCLEKDASRRLANLSDARAEIERVQAGQRGVSRRTTALLAAATVAAAVAVPVAVNTGGLRDWLFGGGPRIRSIAVLPLANLSGNPDQEYFSDGMTESLITDLAKIGALKVISRTSAMSYKGTKKSLREIATELNVDAILEGSAIRTGNRIRITAQLIDAKTDQHLWADSYNRDFADVLVLQSEVARIVAQQVRAQLTPQEQTRLASTRTVNPEAHEAYLRGTFHRSRLTPRDMDTAQRYFEVAIEKDPNYALGHAGLAMLWGARQQMGFASPRQASPKIFSAAEKALALDGSLPEVHYALGRMKTWTQWDFAGAEAAFRRAIELNPSYPDARVFYARLLNFLRRPAEAMPQIERALELDPHNSLFRAMYAVDLCYVRRYDEAIAQARRVLATDPNQAVGEGALRIAFVGKGMLKEAVEIQITRITQSGDLELARVLQRGYDQGKYLDSARAAAELLEARLRSGTFVPAGQISMFFGLARMADKTLDWMERAVEERDPNVLGFRLALGGFPVLEENPRFQAILRRIGLP